jgi:glycosyltransferase involved in cell wall biosynthesis
MRLLNLRWILWAGFLRTMSDPDRIRLHIRGQLWRGTVGAAGLVDRAVASDDLVEAERLLDHVADSDPNRESLQAAVLLLAGHITEAEAQARVALESTSRSGRRRARRVLRRVARIRRELIDGATAPAPRRPVPVYRGSQRDALRVLHVLKNSLPQVQAGYTIRTQEVLRAQQAAGINAQAVTRLGFPVAQGHLAARTEVVSGVRYHRLLAADGSDVAQFGRRLAHLARQEQTDVLHAATDHVNGRAALFAAHELGCPMVYEVRGFLEDSWATRHGGDERAASSEWYTLARARESEVMRASDAVITLGPSMADEIRSRGVAAERVWIVPNAVNDRFLTPPRESGSVRAALGLPRERTLVGAITTVHSFEGLGTLLAAVLMSREEGVDVGAVIVGNGPALGSLKRHFGEHDAIRWVDRVDVDAAIDWYDSLDAVVIPREDYRVTRLVTPLKPVEALARERLVIASDLPALREATGGHARFVAPGDVEALAAELRLIDTHRALGLAGRAWVINERQWSRVVAGYQDAYAFVSGR